jgi:hypothetical protein
MSEALSFRRGRKCNSGGVVLPPLSSHVDGNEKRGKRKLRHSGSRFVVAVARVEGEHGERGAGHLPASLHSLSFLVTRLLRDGVNMAEEGRVVRVEERLKIKIGELLRL